MPRTLNIERRQTNGVLRGYGMQGSHSSSYGSASVIAGMPGFGRSMKEAVHAKDDWWRMGLTAYAECLPRYENYVSLDPEVRDAWGIPAARIRHQWGDNEMKLYKIMLDEAEELLLAAGAQLTSRQQEPRWPGGSTHELGGARMGDNPKNSVVNRWRQAHDVKNLFVTDGAVFPLLAVPKPDFDHDGHGARNLRVDRRPGQTGQPSVEGFENMPAYKRILLKLSGEALGGEAGFGLDARRAGEIAAETAALVRSGVQTGLVLGGGNYFRGVRDAGDKLQRTTVDSMGDACNRDQRSGLSRPAACGRRPRGSDERRRNGALRGSLRASPGR